MPGFGGDPRLPQGQTYDLSAQDDGDVSRSCDQSLPPSIQRGGFQPPKLNQRPLLTGAGTKLQRGGSCATGRDMWDPRLGMSARKAGGKSYKSAHCVSEKEFCASWPCAVECLAPLRKMRRA